MDEEERLRKVEAGKEKLAAYRLKKRAGLKNERTEQEQASSAGSSPNISLEIVQDDASGKQDRQEDILQILQMRVSDLEEIISGKTSALEAALEEIDVLKAENAIEKDAHHKLVLNFQKGIAQRDALIEKLTNTVQESMQTRAALETEGEHLAQVVASLQNQLQMTTDIVQGQQWPNTVKETMYIDLLNQKLAMEVQLQNYEAEIHNLQRSEQVKQLELQKLTDRLRKEQLSSDLEVKSLKLQMEHLHNNYMVIIKEYKDRMNQQCSEYEEKLHQMEVKNVHRKHSQAEDHLKEITVLKNMLLKLSSHVESNDCEKHEIDIMLNELREMIETKEMSSQQFCDIVDSNDLLINALSTVKFLKQQFKILVADVDLTKCDLKKCKDSYKRTLNLQKKEVTGYKYNLSELPDLQAIYNILPESNNGCDIEMFSSDEDSIPVLTHLRSDVNEDHFIDFHFACLSSVIIKLLKAKEDIRYLDSEIEKLSYKEILGKERVSPCFDEHMNLFIEKIKDFIKAVDLSKKMQATTSDEFCSIDSSHTEKNQLEAFGEDEKSPALCFRLYEMTHSESIHYKACIDAIEKKLNDSIRETVDILNEMTSVKERYLKDIFQLSASVTEDNLKEVVTFKQLIDTLEVQALELSDHEEGIYEKLQEAKNDWEKNQMEAAAFKSVFFDYKEMIERLQKYTSALETQTSNELLPESYWDLFKISVGSLGYYKKLTSHYNLQVSTLKKQLQKKDNKMNFYRRQLSEYQQSLEKYKTLFTADVPISKMLKTKLRSKEFMDMMDDLTNNLKETKEKVCAYQSNLNMRQTEMEASIMSKGEKEKESEFLDLDRQKREVSVYAEFLMKYHAFLEIYRQQIDTENELSCKDDEIFMLKEGQKHEEKQVLLERQIEKLKIDLLLATQLMSLFKVEKEVLLRSYEAEIKIYKDQLCQLLNNLQKSRETKQNLLQASLKPTEEESCDKHVRLFSKMIQDEICDLTFHYKPVTDLQKELQFMKTVKQKVASDSTHMQSVISDEYNFENSNVMALEELAVQYLKAQGIIAAKEEIQSALEKRINELEDAHKKVNVVKEANTELLEAIVHYLKLYELITAKDEIEEGLLKSIEHLESSLYKLLNVHREKAEKFIAKDALLELDQLRNTVLIKCKELENVKSICKCEMTGVISHKMKQNNNDDALFLLQEFKQQEAQQKSHLLMNDITYTETTKSPVNIEADEKPKTFRAAIIAAGGEQCVLGNTLLNPECQYSLNENNLFSRFAIKLLRHSRTLEKEKIELVNRVKKHSFQVETKALEDYLHLEDQRNIRLQYRELSELVYLKTKINHLVHENTQFKRKIGMLMQQNQICHEAKAFLLRELELERKRRDEKAYKHELAQYDLQLQNENSDAVENLLKVLDSKGKEVINLKEHLRLMQTATEELKEKLESSKRDEAAHKATINFLKDQGRKLCDELRAVWRKNFELQYKLTNSEKEISNLTDTVNNSLSWDKEQGIDPSTKSWTHKRECMHEDLYSAMEEITGQVEALRSALSVIRSEYKKLSREMQALRNSVALEEQHISPVDDMDILDKKINEILHHNIQLNLNDTVLMDEFQNSEVLKLQQQNDLLKKQLEELKRCLRDREAEATELKSNLEKEIQIQKLNVQHWKLEVKVKQCESYIEKAVKIHDDQDNTAIGESILYKEWEEQIERIQCQLDEVHLETLAAMKAHLEEQCSIREMEMQKKFNAELLNLKQDHLKELSQLQKQLEASRQKIEFLTLKELNQELGSWSIFENSETKDLIKVKEKLHAELEEILGNLDQKQSSISDHLKAKFESYYVHQIAAALKIARESINSLHEQEISALKSQYETEMSVMQTRLQIDGYEKVLKVQQELHKKHKDEINCVTKQLEAQILKIKQLYNPGVGSTLLSQIRRHTCVEYTTGLKKLVEIWVADFKQKLDKLNRDTEKHLSEGRTEELISITELVDSKEQVLALATALQNEFTKSLQNCLESIGSLIESANFKLKRELEFSNEAMEKTILQTKLEKVLKENEELVKDHKFAMEYQMSEHSREMAKLHAQISDGTAVVALRQELEAKHNKEMEELRKYFEKKCAELEQNYSEEVFMKRKSKSSDSSSEEEFLTEMYGPQHLTPLTHICDSCPESNKKESVNVHEPNIGKQIMELDVPAFEFNYDCHTWLLKLKEDYESKLEDIFQGLCTVYMTDVLGGEVASAKDSSSNSYSPEKEKFKNVPTPFEKRLESTKKLLIGMRRQEYDEIKGLYEESLSRQVKAITRQIKEKGEKNISAIKYDLYEKQRKVITKMEEQLGDLMVDKMGKASAELVLQKLENEWKFHDEVEKRSEEESKEKALHLQKEMKDKFERELGTRIEVERKLLKEEYDEMVKSLRKSIETEQVLLAEEIDDVSHPRELVQLQEKFAAQYKKEIILLKEQHAQEIEKLKCELESRSKHNSFQPPPDEKMNVTEGISEVGYQNLEMDASSQAENMLISNEELKHPLDLEKLNKERVCLQKANALLKDLVYELTRYVCLCEHTVNDAINKSFKLDFSDSNIKQDQSLSCTMDSICSHEGTQIEEKHESLNMTLEMPVEIRESSAGHSLNISTSHMQFHFAPDVSNILSLIEDQMLGDNAENDKDITLNLQAELHDCLKRLNNEANAIFMLSSKLNKNQQSDNASVAFEEKLYTVSKQLEEEIKAKEALQVELEKLQAQANMFMAFQDIQQEMQRLKENYSLDLYAAHKRIMELEHEVGSKETVNEGFGQITQSQLSRRLENMNQLQDRARTVLSESTLDIQNAPHLQLIEELCYEGDRLSEDARKEREDLQLQIESLEEQLKEAIMQKLAAEASKEELESELKANNDKVWCLHDIITDLESQIQAKTQYETTLEQQLHELHKILEHQKTNHQELVDELELLRRDSGKAELAEHICHLEEQLQKHRLHMEQFQSNSTAVRLMKAQLRELEATVDRKTKDLESLHAVNSSASCSSPSEDISIREQLDATRCDTPEEAFVTSSPVCLPLDELHRLQDKLQRHSRAEEVALKKIRDLEMQLKNIKKNEEEAIMEKDTLQSKVEEQLLKISDLESKLSQHSLEYHCLNKDMYNEVQSKLHYQEKQLKESMDTLEIKEQEVKELKETLNQVRALAVTQEKEWNIKHMKEVDTVCMLRDKCQELENDKQRLESLLERLQKEHSLFEQDKMSQQCEFRTDASCIMKSEQSEQSLDIKASKSVNMDIVSASDESSKESKIVSASDESSKESKILEVGTSEKKSSLLGSSWASDMFAAHSKHHYGDSVLMESIPSPEPIPYYFAEQADLNNQDYIIQLKTAVDKSLTKLEIYEGELNFLNTRVSEQEDLISKLNEEKFLAEKRVKLLEVSEDELTKKLESLLLEYNILKHELQTLKKETVPKDHLIEKVEKIRKLQEEKEMLETNVKQLRSCLEELTKRMDFVLDQNNNLTAELQLVKQDKISLEQQFSEEKILSERKLRELEVSHSALAKKTEVLLSENDMLKEQLQNDKEEAILLASDELEEKVKKELEISVQLDTSLLQSISASSEENECNISEPKPSPDLTAVVHKAVNIGIEGLNPSELASLVEHLCKAASSFISHSDIKVDYLNYEEMKTVVNRIASLEKTLIRTIQENEKKTAESEIYLQQEKKRFRELQELLEKEHIKVLEMQNSMDVQTRAMFDLMTEKDILMKEGSSIENRLQQHVVQLQGQKTAIKFLEEELQKEKKKVKQLQVQLNTERQRFKIDRINDADFIEKLRLRLETALTAEEKLRNELERERLNPKAHMNGADSELATRKLQRQLEIELQKHSALELELKRAQEEVLKLHGKIETEYCINKHKLETERYEKEQLHKELIIQNSQLSEMKTEITNLQEQLSLKTAETEALERKIAIIRASELQRQRSNEARQEEEKRQREALLTKQIKLSQKISDLEEEIATLKAEHAGRLPIKSVDLSQSAQTNKLMYTGEISKDENLLLRNNTESVLLLARLTTERYELQQRINDLEDKLKRISSLQDKTEYDAKYERSLKFTNVRSASVQTETDCKSVAVDSDMDMEERVRYLFGRYLRAESYKKALIWQKRYLLVVLGGYLEPESKTISQLAQLSDSEEAKLQDKISDSRRPIARFRSAVLVIVALSRMHYLVRRWRHGRRTVNNTALNRIFTEAALDSAPTSYHGARRRGSSTSTQSWVGSQGHLAYGSHLRYPAEKEHHSVPSEKKSFQA